MDPDDVCTATTNDVIVSLHFKLKPSPRWRISTFVVIKISFFAWLVTCVSNGIPCCWNSLAQERRPMSFAYSSFLLSASSSGVFSMLSEHAFNPVSNMLEYDVIPKSTHMLQLLHFVSVVEISDTHGFVILLEMEPQCRILLT